jgi:hypothetical protein
MATTHEAIEQGGLFVAVWLRQLSLPRSVNCFEYGLDVRAQGPPARTPEIAEQVAELRAFQAVGTAIARRPRSDPGVRC